jgi:hypothetical protein
MPCTVRASVALYCWCCKGTLDPAFFLAATGIRGHKYVVTSQHILPRACGGNSSRLKAQLRPMSKLRHDDTRGVGKGKGGKEEGDGDNGRIGHICRIPW